MATCTILRLVSHDEIAKLTKEPDSIRDLDKPETDTFRTYYLTAINYFLTGSAYPGAHSLSALLGGEKNVATAVLENGAFDLVMPPRAEKLLAALEKVDLTKLHAKVKKADLEALRDEQEVDEELALEESGDPAGQIVTAVEGLKVFYAKAAAGQVGVVMYTS